ncbi:MAG: O-antigen polymerase, partial [Streptomyces sp.]|nr:O-antigen polymerase [Streptomyces sp.]
METTAGGPPGAARAEHADGLPHARGTVRREGGRFTDAAGVVVLGCCSVWALVAAAGRPARPEGTLLA